LAVHAVEVEVEVVMLAAEVKKAFAEVVRARQEGLAALERAWRDRRAPRPGQRRAHAPGSAGLGPAEGVSTIADAAVEGGSTFIIGEAALPLRAAKPA
jgi:regulator of protease activity HflC (stomatin/prohibitin superfamily)